MFLIKPDAFRRKIVSDVLKPIEEAFTIIDMEYFQFTLELIDEFYSAHLEKDFYSQLQSTMISGPSLAIMVKGTWNSSMRSLVDSLRDHSGHNLAENSIHCSDSFDSDIRESDLIFGRH